MRVHPATYFRTSYGFFSPNSMREIVLADGSRAQLVEMVPVQPPSSNEFVAEGCEKFEEGSRDSR
jgi:hypothetical protein